MMVHLIIPVGSTSAHSSLLAILSYLSGVHVFLTFFDRNNLVLWFIHNWFVSVKFFYLSIWSFDIYFNWPFILLLFCLLITQSKNRNQLKSVCFHIMFRMTSSQVHLLLFLFGHHLLLLNCKPLPSIMVIIVMNQFVSI